MRAGLKTPAGIVSIVCALTGSFAQAMAAQGSAGASGENEPRALVDMPTAGMLASGTFGLDIDFFQRGGLLVTLTAGIFDRLSVGVSYGGSGLIGSEVAVMNPGPGANIKLRLIEENEALPAIVLGFDSQGREGYMKELDRYRIKSPGLYAVASKNYNLAGYLSIHGGTNYSLERADDDEDLNVFVGVEKTIGPIISAIVEYNSALNDSKSVGEGDGYLNFGLRFSLGGGLTMGIDVKDVLENAGEVHFGNRAVKLEYVGMF
jgi:hypothetical protein